MEQITVKAMLAAMETGDPFSVVYVTHDRKRRKGGRIHRIPEAVLLQQDPNLAAGTFAHRPATPNERKIMELNELRRAPHHQKWYTRNIRLLMNGYPTSEIRKLHPPLVILFNNLIVVA